MVHSVPSINDSWYVLWLVFSVYIWKHNVLISCDLATVTHFVLGSAKVRLQADLPVSFPFHWHFHFSPLLFGWKPISFYQNTQPILDISKQTWSQSNLKGEVKEVINSSKRVISELAGDLRIGGIEESSQTSLRKGICPSVDRVRWDGGVFHPWEWNIPLGGQRWGLWQREENSQKEADKCQPNTIDFLMKWGFPTVRCVYFCLVGIWDESSKEERGSDILE